MQAPETLQALELELNADVAEWAPSEPQLLAVGMYQLDEASGQRNGKLHVYSLTQPASSGGGEEEEACHSASLALVATAPLAGVFDLRWHPAAPLLAAALADGAISLIPIDPALAAASAASPGAACAPLSAACQAGAPPNFGMAVSLDWARAPGCLGDTLVASYSSGALQQFQVTPGGLTSLATWQAHSLEAWAAATDHWQGALVYSGGDDSAFKVWDSRQGFQQPAWGSAKVHGAGVCCVASSPHAEHAVATGSYDERIRQWDMRAPSRPVLQSEVSTGGSVWRLKWHPSDPRLLLAACMYNGFAVYCLEDGGSPAERGSSSLGTPPCGDGSSGGSSGDWRLAASYCHAEGALSYGADWCRLPGAKGASLAATCSFYDNRLHLWALCPVS